MTTSSIPVITIDGPSGVGKGTVALQVAKKLGWHTLDSGALYRVLALAAQYRRIPSVDMIALVALASHLVVSFEPLNDLSGIRVIFEDEDVTQALRSETCATMASQIATLPGVRQALLAKQRNFKKAPGLVADGRDMGTVVFPEAQVKIFLTATAEERAHRRYKQLKEKESNVKLANLIKEIAARDQRDSTRAVAPLAPAPDALVIDNTGLTIENVVTCVLEQVFNKHPMAHF